MGELCFVLRSANEGVDLESKARERFHQWTQKALIISLGLLAILSIRYAYHNHCGLKIIVSSI